MTKLSHKPTDIEVFEGSTGKLLAKCDFAPQNVGMSTSLSFCGDYRNRSEGYNASVAMGNGPIKSDEFVEIDTKVRARFVKIVLKGNTFNGWSRISEVKIYGG